MLIDFRVENHRSLRDEQALTMEAGRVGDDDDPRPRRVAGVDTPLLPVAVLYGANASGKSKQCADECAENCAKHQTRSLASP